MSKAGLKHTNSNDPTIKELRFPWTAHQNSWELTMGAHQGWGAGVGAGCFWLLRAGAVWKKNGAGAALKKIQEPEPEPLKN